MSHTASFRLAWNVRVGIPRRSFSYLVFLLKRFNGRASPGGNFGQKNVLALATSTHLAYGILNLFG